MAGDNSWRVIAQRVLTREFLHWDVPLGQSTTSRELSGPGGVFGTINPEMLGVIADDGRPLLEEWSTALYVEEAGRIRGGGIINKLPTKGTERQVEAAGFNRYPTGIPYVENYLPNDFTDPTQVFADIWTYVQSFPDSDLGVTVNPAETWHVLTNGEGPFVMRDFENRDCGETLDSIAATVPFDYLERHVWTPDHDDVLTSIDLGFPRLGRKRDDLRFADSENVEDFDYIEPNAERYANDVYVFGRGSGRAMARSRSAERDGRLRRCAVVNLADHGGQGYLDRYAKQERRRRRMELDIPEVTVKDHANARLGAIQPGDDILFEAEVPWHGDVRMWLRVLAINETGDAPGRAVLKTQRSDTFTYASAKSPTGEKVPVSM